MDAYDRSSAIEHATLTRVAEMYNGALKKALKNKKAFLKKIKDVETGKIKPPQYYIDTDQVKKWKEGFYRELMRQEAVIDGIMEELNKAGVEASELIRGALVEIYQENRREAVEGLSEIAVAEGINVSFSQYDKKQIQALIQRGESPFSELAYKNMGNNPVIRRKLQTELGIATILGESQRDIIKRIQKVTGQSYRQAKRVAQTERTRVQSQARWQTGQEAAAMGVNVVNEWSTRMVNSRDSHIALDGVRKPQGEVFHTIWGNELRYPGDPRAPAREVINCHCVLVPDVVIGDKKSDLQGTYSNDIMKLQGRGDAMIDKPIEQRNTGKGNPNAIILFDRSLNNRQKSLLDKLPNFNDSALVRKSDVNMHDLAALTAVTGCEYALFTKKGERLVVRGNAYKTQITVDMAVKMRAEGYRWSGHTHPGTDMLSLTASDGDYAILEAFRQKRSVIYNSLGRMTIFEGGEE